jgi:AcrR family transcriptional regulator
MNLIETPDRKDQLREVAQTLFKEKGYAGSSMRDIAQIMGIEAPSIYNHVNSKHDLLKRICYEVADKFLVIINNIKKTSSHPAVTLQTIILEHVKVVTENNDASAVFTNEWRFLEASDLENFIKLRNKYERFIEKTIKDGLDQGIFKTNNTKLVTLSLLTTLNGIYHWYNPKGRLKAEDISHNIMNLYFLGLKR